MFSIFLLSFLLTIPPGPATLCVMSYAPIKRSFAFSCILGFILCEGIIFYTYYALLGDLRPDDSPWWLKLIAAAFLCLFVSKTRHSLNLKLNSLPTANTPLQKNKTQSASHIKAFIEASKLSLLNPAVWMAVLALFSMTSSQLSFKESSIYILSWQMGAALWLSILQFASRKISQRHLLVFQKISLHGITAIAIFYALSGLSGVANAKNNYSLSKKHHCHMVKDYKHKSSASSQQKVNSKRYDCVAPTRHGSKKKFHVLELEGNFADQARQHAYLMAAEMQSNSVITETLHRVNSALNSASGTEGKIKQKIFQCFLNRIEKSSAKELIHATHAFYNGYTERIREKGLQQKLSLNDVKIATYGIELSIALEGLERRLEEGNVLQKGNIYFELLKDCSVLGDIGPVSISVDLVSDLSRMVTMGCIGGVTPSQMNDRGQLMHARNLDANLMKSWSQYPSFFVVKNTQSHKNDYIGAGTAGLIYTGGISGINDQGLSASLHQMSTKNYKINHWSKDASIGPFMQQRLLSESSTIDNAKNNLESSSHFGSWSFLVSNGFENKAMSFEATGDKSSAARIVSGHQKNGGVLGQSNHFLDPKMKNQHFTYSFNKSLESRSRISVITTQMNQQLLSRKKVNKKFMMNRMAEHWDAFTGFSSFGRTAVKAYNVMSTVALPAAGELWMTLGDTMPAAHSTYVGIKAKPGDFKNWELIATDYVDTYESTDVGLKNWEKSLHTYAQARIEHNESTMLQNPNKKIKLINKSIKELDLAQKQSLKDGYYEFAYDYMKARMHQELYKIYSKDIKNESAAKTELKKAKNLFGRLIIKDRNKKIKVHEYHKILFRMYWLDSEIRLIGTETEITSNRKKIKKTPGSKGIRLRKSNTNTETRLARQPGPKGEIMAQEARSLMNQLIQKEKIISHKGIHPDLLSKNDELRYIEKGYAMKGIPKADFVTVE